MMKQYRDAKSAIPADCILLFRMGDFYEVFFDDAKIAAPILDVALTKRAGIAMCGVPHHALEAYLPRLLSAGKKVAIAEQLEDPKTAKGLVKRGISRIISPGAISDGSLLSPSRNNYLAALLVSKKGRIGLASIDISTGELRATEPASMEALVDELQRLAPPECIVPESLHEEWKASKMIPPALDSVLWTPAGDHLFDEVNAADFLLAHFSVLSLDGFGCQGMSLGIQAAGAVLAHLRDGLKQSVAHVTRIRAYSDSDCLILDQATRRNLEIVETGSNGKKEDSLVQILDKTSTPMGARKLRDCLLRPLRNRKEINRRLDAVEALKEDPLTLAELSEMISLVRDLERICARLNLGNASPRDMATLSQSLKIVPGIRSILDFRELPLFCEIRSSLSDHSELVDRIDGTLVEEPPLSIGDGGLIRTGYSSELDDLRKASTEGKEWVAQFQAKEQARAKIRNLKVKYNKVFGYHIEISRSNLEQVPSDYIRKQTLVNAERFITPELKEMENRIVGAEERAKALEQEIFQELRNEALKWTSPILKTADAIATIDLISSFAECARTLSYVRPEISDDETLLIRGGRHPVLDAVMKKERFVPNDTFLDGAENRVMIITGPNMAGKSTYIRQVGIIALMAHCGSFVPAESAKIGILDRIFTRVGAADDISKGQSTFMVEMLETANILNHATPKSLVILDEIGRGTSTFDGLSIAWAVAEFLHDKSKSGARTLFATHYHELTELAITCPGVKNYNVAVREHGEQIIFLRQIVAGSADKSYGIHVAKLAGLPKDVIERAKEILGNLESDSLAESGQPSLARRRKGAKTNVVSETEQPSLFNWRSI